MYEPESRGGEEANEAYLEDSMPLYPVGDKGALDARRRIERLRELRHLRMLLNDPEFDDFD